MNTSSKLGFNPLAAIFSLLVFCPAFAESENIRQQEVAQRGAQVMPFNLEKTQHIFTKTDDGGTQQVIAKVAQDQEQITLIRGHLNAIAAKFAVGDFSGPASIHGGQMPGLARLRQAKPNEWHIEYRDVDNGAEIRYSSALPDIIQAIHDWFDAQLSDHGHHAMPGH